MKKNENIAKDTDCTDFPKLGIEMAALEAKFPEECIDPIIGSLFEVVKKSILSQIYAKQESDKIFRVRVLDILDLYCIVIGEKVKIKKAVFTDNFIYEFNETRSEQASPLNNYLINIIKNQIIQKGKGVEF